MKQWEKDIWESLHGATTEGKIPWVNAYQGAFYAKVGDCSFLLQKEYSYTGTNIALCVINSKGVVMIHSGPGYLLTKSIAQKLLDEVSQRHSPEPYIETQEVLEGVLNDISNQENSPSPPPPSRPLRPDYVEKGRPRIPTVEDGGDEPARH